MPALKAIRRCFPNAYVAFLGNADSQGRHVTAREVVPPNGLIDEWILYPSADSTFRFSDAVRLLKLLRRSRFDTLVYLAPRIRKSRAVSRDLLFFRFAGIRNVIGAQGFEPLSRAGSEARLPRIEHEADHLLRRLSLSGVSIPDPGKAQIELALTEEEHRKADAWLRENVPEFGATRLVGFGPGSKWPSKIWPEERFTEVGHRLIQQHAAYPIVFGGAEDWPLGERLIVAWGRGANAAGILPVRQAAGALAHCLLYVGNDTGTMHLAAAMGTPCVAIMAALDWPGHWNPYGTGHTVLRSSVPCEGCLLRVCERQGMRCLKEITVEQVLGACNESLFRKCSDDEHYSSEREMKA